MDERKEQRRVRDDAESQPESGYPGGQLPTEPSAEPNADEKRQETQVGSEAEFDSDKLKSV